MPVLYIVGGLALVGLLILMLAPESGIAQRMTALATQVTDLIKPKE